MFWRFSEEELWAPLIQNMALKDLEKRLYNQKQSERSQIKNNSEESLKKTSASGNQDSISGWGNVQEDNFEKNVGKSMSKISRISRIFFWVATPIMLIAIGFSGFYLYQYFSTDREIIFTLSSPAKAMVGVPFDLEAIFNNGSQNTLSDVGLSVFLPEGAVILGEDSDKRIITKKIDDIEAGLGFKEKIPVVVFANSEEVKNFDVSVSYNASLNSRFEKRQSVNVEVSEPAVKLDLTAPEKILNNEAFEINVDYSNVSDIDFSNARLFLTFPQNFILKESEPMINSGVYEIGALAKEDKGKILIKGTVIGAEQSFFDIKARIEADYNGQNYPIIEKTASVYIAPSPLALKVILNDSQNYFTFSGDALKYRIFYQNNTDVNLSDVVISAKLSGEMFDFASLKTTGGFNSKNSIVAWNAANVSDLRQLAAGANGSVEFEIKTKQDFPIKRLSDKNFILKVDAEISSPTVPYFVAADKTIGLARLETKVSGRIALEQSAYFKEPAYFDIVNQGSLPPKVNQANNYAIHWLIRNYATDVKDVNIKANLAPEVKFTGIVKSNVSSTPIYNDRTQEITWSIDKIMATKGIVNKPIEAVFQIEATPNILQVNKELPLVGSVSILAFDEFVGVELNNLAEAISTRYLKDAGLDPKLILVSQ